MLVAGKKRRRGRAEHAREGAIEDRVGVAGCHTESLRDYVGRGGEAAMGISIRCSALIFLATDLFPFTISFPPSYLLAVTRCVRA